MKHKDISEAEEKRINSGLIICSEQDKLCNFSDSNRYTYVSEKSKTGSYRNSKARGPSK
jgi:hypothetical protein